jgi:hypothetical protein
MEATFEGGDVPEGAVASYVDDEYFWKLESD